MLAFASLAAAALGLVAEPAPITVPAALLAITSMPEPSGVVFSPTLQRYLIVSDDSGDKLGGTNHAPWLLAMSPDGVLDQAPVPILGLPELNDAEALCSGPAGSFFLATSHSANKKGHDKPARRQLLQLQLDGRALKVLGKLDLAPAIAASATVPSGGIDIEGLAFRDGALYVGLKAPQTEGGDALILRIAEVLLAIQAGAVVPEKVRRFAEVPLRVETAGGPAVQGISDLMFLPDGSLVLLANSPKKLPPDGGGALWWLRPGSPPRLLRRFLGLKPEGVTLTSDGQALLIVFDRDRQQPLWLRQALPGQP